MPPFRRVFPRLDAETDFPFPPVDTSSPDGIVCEGGNLSPGMLVSAYRRGIFPWYGFGEPILWWSPDPRFVLLPERLHVSSTMRKLLRRGGYSLTLDTDFPSVIKACASIRRPGQKGTWIVPDMIEAYTELHRLGLAHSVEVWKEGVLAGGLYGVSLGRAFFGESMFSRESGASRFGFLALALRLKHEGYSLIDSQVYTDYLSEMGAAEIPREEYLKILSQALESPTRREPWSSGFPGFPHSPEFDQILKSGAGPNGAARKSGTR